MIPEDKIKPPVTRKQKAISVIEAFENGKTLKQACKDSGLSINEFYNGIHAYPKLDSRYIRAKTQYADVIVSDILEIADDLDENGLPKKSDPNYLKVKIDSRKWVASKYLPRVYGDRVDLNIRETIDIRAALDTAKSRVIEGVSQRIKEVIAIEEDQ